MDRKYSKSDTEHSSPYSHPRKRRTMSEIIDDEMESEWRDDHRHHRHHHHQSEKPQSGLMKYLALIIYVFIIFIMFIITFFLKGRAAVKAVIFVISAIYALITGFLIWMMARSGYTVATWVIMVLSVVIWTVILSLLFFEILVIDF